MYAMVLARSTPRHFLELELLHFCLLPVLLLSCCSVVSRQGQRATHSEILLHGKKPEAVHEFNKKIIVFRQTAK